AAFARQGDACAQELAQVGVFVAGEKVAVGLAERAEPLDLEALPGVVLPHELARGKAEAISAREQRLGRPPVAVAFEREEERGQPRGAQRAGGGDRLDVREPRPELNPPRTTEPAKRAFGRDQRSIVLPVDVFADRPARAEAEQ